MDVIKEVIAELVTASIGGYFGLSSKRTSNLGWVDLIFSAAKKQRFLKGMDADEENENK